VGHAGVDNNRAGVHDDGNVGSTIEDDDASASDNAGNAGVDNIVIEQNDDNPTTLQECMTWKEAKMTATLISKIL
jgi:hypothetical protein